MRGEVTVLRFIPLVEPTLPPPRPLLDSWRDGLDWVGRLRGGMCVCGLKEGLLWGMIWSMADCAVVTKSGRKEDAELEQGLYQTECCVAYICSVV